MNKISFIPELVAPLLEMTLIPEIGKIIWAPWQENLSSGFPSKKVLNQPASKIIEILHVESQPIILSRN